MFYKYSASSKTLRSFKNKFFRVLKVKKVQQGVLKRLPSYLGWHGYLTPCLDKRTLYPLNLLGFDHHLMHVPLTIRTSKNFGTLNHHFPFFVFGVNSLPSFLPFVPFKVIGFGFGYKSQKPISRLNFPTIARVFFFFFST